MSHGLDLREHLAHIDRSLAETRRLLAAAGRRPEPEGLFQPTLAMAGLVGNIITIATLCLQAAGMVPR